MSFLNVTFSYVRPIDKLLFGLGHGFRQDFGLRQKRAFLKTTLTLFILLSMGYIYLNGRIITLNLINLNLKDSLLKTELKLQELESSVIALEQKGGSTHFLQEGFETPKHIRAVTRTTNVAEVQKLLLQE